MTYNTTIQSFTLQDAIGSYDWLLEGIDDLFEMSEQDMLDYIDTHIELSKEQDVLCIEERAESKSYPCFGYTTAQVFDDADEYIDFMREQMEEDYAAERDSILILLKSARRDAIMAVL